MSNIAERLGLTNGEREVKLGKSFTKGAKNFYHTFRYDFKPASVDTSKVATVDIGEGHQVTVTVPHVDKGNGTTHTVFKGCKKPYTKECVLIIDHATGEITLEKLTYNVQLKKTRAEGSSKINQSVLENTIGNNKKTNRQKLSPHRKLWSSNYSVPKCSPLPRSPNSQPSPPSRTSPSVPSATSSSDIKHSSSQSVPDAATSTSSKIDVDMDVPEIGVLTSSDSSGESSSSPSDSESSDDEAKNPTKAPTRHGNVTRPPSKLTNGSSSCSKKVHPSSQPATSTVLSMPKFSQLSEDLQLSESDSDD